VPSEPRRTLTGALVAAAAAAALGAAWRRRIDPWQRAWGTASHERDAVLPGDELLPHADAVATRAIGIARPPAEVWPWVAQIGQDRGGFYSYTFIENALGAGIRNADRVHPEWQDRAVGELVPGDRRGRVAWEVVHRDPGRALVLRGAAPPEAAASPPYEFIWSFVLRDDGRGGTRCLARERWAHDGSLGGRVAVALLVPGSFVMTRGMLRGLRRRASRHP
jgi:hypothetical protein